MDDVQAVAEALKGHDSWWNLSGRFWCECGHPLPDDEFANGVDGWRTHVAEVAVAALRARDSGDTVTVPRGIWLDMLRYVDACCCSDVARDRIQTALAKAGFDRHYADLGQEGEQ